MKAGPQSTVICVAAPPGGGKTTLCDLLSEKLHHAPVLHYDDYEAITKQSPDDLEAWVDRGAPLDEVPLPGFADRLSALSASGATFVLIDSPTGRAHRETASVIDFLIYIDTPLDLALARAIRSQATLAKQTPGAAGLRQFVTWLDDYLEIYARFTRRLYAMQRETVMPQADLVLDGTLPPHRLAELALQAVGTQ